MNDIKLAQLWCGKEVWLWEIMNNVYSFYHTLHNSLNLKNLQLPSPKRYTK